MSDAQRVIDDITALVDEQMADGEPEVGFSYGDPTFPPCSRCAGRWHGLPLGGCPGADAEGPLHHPNWDDLRESMDLVSVAFQGMAEVIADAFRSLTASWSVWGRVSLDVPEPPPRCTLAARRRMHSDQLRVQRRAARRMRRRQ